MILKSNCILCLFWNFIFDNKNGILLRNLNREKRFIFLDIDNTRNNNTNLYNWSDSAASSVQQCDSAYVLREEDARNVWRHALACQSEAKAVMFWRANRDQVVFFRYPIAIYWWELTPSIGKQVQLSSRMPKLTESLREICQKCQKWLLTLYFRSKYSLAYVFF